MGLTVLEAKSPVPGPWTLESYTGVRVAIFALTKEMDCILRSARSDHPPAYRLYGQASLGMGRLGGPKQRGRE